MLAGPLDDARLKRIEDCLNTGRFDDAQRQLAALATVQGLGRGGIPAAIHRAMKAISSGAMNGDEHR